MDLRGSIDSDKLDTMFTINHDEEMHLSAHSDGEYDTNHPNIL